jgi:gliding motility-associated lipoprotein GldD
MKVQFIAVKYLTAICISSLVIAGCNSEYTFKPRGYFRIDFPQKAFRIFDTAGYPYSFEYPVYADVVKDSTFFEARPENPWWINIDFPQFDARIYISYKTVTKKNFDSLVNDAFKLSYKQHTNVATGREDEVIETPNNVHGMYFTLTGNTATANQFFLTDSTKHFLRGALYFNATPNEDSLSLINNFLRADILHLINTIKWK